jgi:hypothetical protein
MYFFYMFIIRYPLIYTLMYLISLFQILHEIRHFVSVSFLHEVFVLYAKIVRLLLIHLSPHFQYTNHRRLVTHIRSYT